MAQRSAVSALALAAGALISMVWVTFCRDGPCAKTTLEARVRSSKGRVRSRMKKSPVESGPPVNRRRQQRSSRAWVSPVAMAGTLLLAWGWGAQPASARIALPACLLEVASPAGARRFEVEVASTPEARHRGLMERTSLAGGHGMLFVFDEAERLAMWMRNTLIPLDMLFFDDNGLLVHLEREAEPNSLRHRQAPVPTRYVLEINGGEGQSLSVTGDTRLEAGSLRECLKRVRK